MDEELIRISFSVDDGDETTGVVRYFPVSMPPEFLQRELVMALNEVLNETRIPRIPEK
jgi:hypothetical protein